MTTDDREREMRLKAAEFHGAMPETGVEIRQEKITDGDWLEYISPDQNVCMEAWVWDKDVIITDHDIEITLSRAELKAWSALLQRAEKIMGGGA